ncbi:MAG: hypothetical protein EOQ28_13625 [Mesorhizobium sp.]|uniref:hypothetical protein n=1 Tax=Mesorhizobium sp. TaxID=1871066 RepID=UPI000FE2A9CC|nr:hypothetical protein [Mesorhizobium sp.]RWA74035.1 MAG: hypothetical protein EOQ28_13625 [Mesorhizobium sp.]RWC05163.1 MAG: hypothetical protein EOQ57_01955 [Mesorhizobium sp.]RWK09668.1 MAG: hypothetical protein EOR42_02940 [Mesorhizobium sp.]RWK13264.1 MAG: hypothetical protein EOR39_01500 [Mesorhizobium sp.]TIQ45052.1 MAG: hypothetical protein E5X47_27525 [Mesorhizobium sp.]
MTLFREGATTAGAVKAGLKRAMPSDTNTLQIGLKRSPGRLARNCPDRHDPDANAAHRRV